jgi:hypothetical protein
MPYQRRALSGITHLAKCVAMSLQVLCWRTGSGVSNSQLHSIPTYCEKHPATYKMDLCDYLIIRDVIVI